ncbi:MAG: dockerin type I repeat-containing protein, partial [Lachnospiraceae bacterium]|nr:dockerin type I repeat-containing protein [Lachnospiraceae bacterium]
NHQYAQSVYDQIGNAAFLRNAIGSDYNAVLTLRIPVYTEMPLVPQGYPEENGSLNKRYAQDGSVLPRGTQTIAMEPKSVVSTTPNTNDVADDPKKNTEKPTTPREEPATVAEEPAPPQEEPTTAPLQTVNYSAGDANGDGKISALDYVAVKNHIMGTKTITDNAKLKAADANGDGKISALDYVRIKNMIMGN